MDKTTLNLLTFLQNGNVVVVHNEVEFNLFVKFLTKRKLAELLPTAKGKPLGYDFYVSVGSRYGSWDRKSLYFECQIGKEGIGVYPYDHSMTVEDWYGKSLLTIKDFDPDEFFCYEYWADEVMRQAECQNKEITYDEAITVAEGILYADHVWEVIDAEINRQLEELQ